MKIEIWSDIMCPFCYIGKRKLERALQKFEHREKAAISWHSYMLQPGLKYEKGKKIYDFLAESKGMHYDHAVAMTQQVAEMAKEVGLDFNFDKIVVANSFDAHRLTHFAKKHSLQDKAEEKLFEAYFVEGKNIGDYAVLQEIGVEVGLDAQKVKQMLDSGDYTSAVNADVNEAQKLSIRGVPFFIFNRKWGLSGAQPEDVFLEVLEKAYEEEHQIIEVASANDLSCEDGSCTI